MAMRYCFDIDGTLCTNTEGDYEKAEPLHDVIRRVNDLYDNGHYILLLTARGSTTGIDWRPVTEKQMEAWGVKYHELFLTKPTADIYVDDKAINIADWVPAVPRGAVLKDWLPLRRRRPDRSPGSSSVLHRGAYLETTYDTDRAPYGTYPRLLGEYLLKHHYGKPGRLLDLGCGRGEHLAMFRDLGFDVAGTDISPSAPALAPGFDVRTADLEKDSLPFPEAGFDMLFSKSVIEHVRNPVAVLENALKALKPGGKAVIMTPSWIHNYWGPFYIDHTHVTPFTAPSLADALSFAGFCNISVQHFYQLPFTWERPWTHPLVRMIAALPLSYRPLYPEAALPDGLNKLVRFSKEVMLFAVAERPAA